MLGLSVFDRFCVNPVPFSAVNIGYNDAGIIKVQDSDRKTKIAANFLKWIIPHYPYLLKRFFYKRQYFTLIILDPVPFTFHFFDLYDIIVYEFVNISFFASRKKFSPSFNQPILPK